MGKKFLLVILVSFISILFSSCSLNNVTNSVSNTLAKESDVKLNAGIQSGNLERVKEAIEDGANLNKIKVSLVSDENPVVLAITKNQDKIAEYLINNGADANYTDNSGRSLLMFSAYNMDVSFCELLIKHGAKVNQEDKNGYTALEYVLDHSRKATTERDINQIISVLLEHGAQIRPITLKAALKEDFSDSESRYSIINRVVQRLIKEGKKPDINDVFKAAIIGDFPKISELIKANKMQKEDEEQILFFTAAFGKVETMKLLEGKEVDIKTCDKLKNTLLIVASQYGNLEMVKYLSSKGIDIEARNKDDNTALMAAIMNDHYETVEYLVKKGAKSYYKIPDYNVFYGALDLASENANVSVMELLIANGYPINNDTMGSAMISAVGNNKIESIKYLLNRGVDPNVGYNGLTPLENACLNGNVEITKILVEHGAKVDGLEVKGKPLYNAAKSGNVDVVEYLIKKGASVNSIPKYSDGSGGESALMAAAYSGQFEVVKLLIENGADINYQNENADNGTALIWATSGGSRHIVEYLIQNGAKVDYKSEKGETALMRAASQGQLDCVKVLIKYKADASIKDKEGHTALDLAKAGKYKGVVDYLENIK